MATLWFLLRSAGSRLVAAVLVGLLSGAASTALLAMVHAVLTRGQAPPAWARPEAFLAVCVLISITRVASHYLVERLGQAAVFDMRTGLSHAILTTPLRQLELIGPARLLTTLTTDVAVVSGAVVTLPILCINAAVVIGCLAYLGTLSLRLVWVLLALVLLGSVSYRLPLVMGARRFSAVRRMEEELFELFRGLVHGSKELKANSARRRGFQTTLARTADAQRRSQISANFLYGAADAWGHLLFFLVIGALLFARPLLGAPPGPVLLGYTLVLLYMMTPLQALLGAMGRLGPPNAALSRIRSLGLALDRRRDGDLAAASRSGKPWSRLRLAGVTHSYGDGTEHGSFTLGPLDLQLRRGELVFLIGGNGSGKTTLAKLLAGFYAPEAGAILLDDEPVMEDARDAYRQGFSSLFQDFYLFRELCSPEGAAGAAGAAGEAPMAQSLLRQLGLHQALRIEDGKLSRTDVSRGQQKRLALLHALLEDRPVYLFDEWAADQDPTFKEIFYTQILAELRRRGKTVVVITHDDQYYHYADRLIELNYGKVQFDGPARHFFAHKLGREDLAEQARAGGGALHQ